MQTCARCGTENTDAAPSCVTCGLPLPAAEAPAQSPVVRTGALQELSRQDLSRTVAGHLDPQLLGAHVASPPAPPSPAEPAPPAPRPAMAATMIGLAPTPAPDVVENRGGNATPHFSRTVLGLAPPEVRGGTVPLSALGGGQNDALSNGRSAGNAALDASAPELDVPPPPAGPPMVKTLLGVARPGIAPINPGTPKQEQAVYPVLLPTPPGGPPLEFPAEEDTREASTESGRKGRWLGLFTLLGALALAGSGLAAFLWLRGPGRIEARAVVDSEGKESLSISCPGCKEGTSVRLGDQTRVLTNGRGLLRLNRKLAVGENRFELLVRSPGSEREARVELNVPLEYRVQADTRSLEKPKPSLTVQVEALPNSTVQVDGKPVTLNASGQASYELDVSSDLTGLDNTARKLDRKIAYRIHVPGGGVASGEVAFQVPILPLTLEAPGPAITIEGERFLLAGRTSKGARVTIADRPITMDAEGQFVQPLSVSSVGETRVTLRASAPDWAPRLFSIHVKRVTSLTEEARARRSQAVASYAALVSDLPRKVGVKVALDGSVTEIGKQPRSTLLLLDVAGGCTNKPCFARVVHGAPASLAAGDKISVFGNIRGSVEGPRPGSQIPEIFADFVLKAPK